ncbi:MAG TPA: hypothetical protein VNS88_09825, partial [Nitrospiraceae bacterium]|nr:hypothetical protein [Nitrospiraceae bacterium]
ARFQDKANFNRKRLVTRMQRLGLSTVERQAYTIRDANLAPNPHSGWGQALLQVHDKNQPEGHELGDWPKKLFSETQSAKLRENLKAITDAMTPEQRSAKAIKANANMTPAQRTARGLKGQKTRFGVTARDVICPYCHAIPGYRCKNGSGEFSNSYHQARINAASTQRAQATQ